MQKMLSLKKYAEYVLPTLLMVTAGYRLSQTDSESKSARQTQGLTCVTVSDPVLGTMRQACNYQVANLC